MVAVPELAIRLAATVAVNCVALTYVVVRGVPFHCTIDPVTKPIPFTVRVKAGPPAVAVVGLRLVIDNALIVRSMAAWAVCLGEELSVTVNMGVKVPAAAGVPLRTPDEPRVMPEGRPVAAQV
jgi:hypothetical protein